MQVILDCERMQYPHTGLFEYCNQLGMALFETKRSKDVLNVYTQKNNEHFFSNEIKFITSKRLHKFIFPSVNSEIQVWHATHQLTKYLPPKNRDIKRVLTIHDLNFLYEKKSARKHASYLSKIQRNIDICDHIVAISEFTRNDIARHLHIDKPVSVIYNGCNVNSFPDFSKPRYSPQKPFIFTIGTVNAKKNFHVLPCLLKNNDFELVIAGSQDANYVQKIIKEANKHGVLNRVKIIGAVTPEEKYWYFKHCSAFALPSTAEGFGIPVIEAMRFGKPVFLSTATSLPEIGGKLAYYFEDFEPIHMQETFKTGIKHFYVAKPSEMIRDYASRFDWIQAANSYWEIYRSLV